MRAQFSPLLMRYMVISLTLYLSASCLMVMRRFSLLRVSLMRRTWVAVSLRPISRLACPFLYAILAGLFCWWAIISSRVAHARFLMLLSSLLWFLWITYLYLGDDFFRNSLASSR